MSNAFDTRRFDVRSHPIRRAFDNAYRTIFCRDERMTNTYLTAVKAYGVQIAGEQVGNKTTYTYIFDGDVKGMTTGGECRQTLTANLSLACKTRRERKIYMFILYYWFSTAIPSYFATSIWGPLNNVNSSFSPSGISMLGTGWKNPPWKNFIFGVSSLWIEFGRTVYDLTYMLREIHCITSIKKPCAIQVPSPSNIPGRAENWCILQFSGFTRINWRKKPNRSGLKTKFQLSDLISQLTWMHSDHDKKRHKCNNEKEK